MANHHFSVIHLLVISLYSSLLVRAVPLQERTYVQTYSDIQAHNPFTDFYEPDLSTLEQTIQTLWGEGDIKFPPHGVGYKPTNPDYEVYEEGEGGPGTRIGTRDYIAEDSTRPGLPYTETSTRPGLPYTSTTPGLPYTDSSSTRTSEIYQSGTSTHQPNSNSYSTPEPPHQPSTSGYEATSTTRAPYPSIQTTSRPTTSTVGPYGQDRTEQAEEFPLPSDRPRCTEPFQAYDDFTGTCYHLATQGPCKGNEWWILDEVTLQPHCTHRPCPPFYAQSPQTQECVIAEEAKVLGLCGDSERLVNDAYGKSRCECRNHSYRWDDGVCYPTYQRGPCDYAHYYLYNTITKQPYCEKNICLEDNMVEVDGQCYQLGDVCGELGDKNIFINPHNGVLGCYDFFRLPIQQTKV